MKRTNVKMSRLLSGLSAGLFFCLMLIFVSPNQMNAQSLSPLPTLKAKAEAQSAVYEALLQVEATVKAKYGTNRPQGDPNYDYLMGLHDAYTLLTNLLIDPAVSVDEAVTSVYPTIVKNMNSAAVVNMTGFYSQNWPNAFVEIVDKLKL